MRILGLPEFLAVLFRTRYYRRAFRAITTGHSNRRRTQTLDFEDIDVFFPADKELQKKYIADIVEAKKNQQRSLESLSSSFAEFNKLIDLRNESEFEEEDEFE